MSPFIQLSRMQLAVLAAVLLIALPTTLFLLTVPTFGSWYVLHVYAPPLERELGFHAAIANHPALAAPTFHVVAVTPGGAFDRAGVKAGDVPEMSEGPISEFYSYLEGHRGTHARLAFTRFTPNPLRELFGKRVIADVAVPVRAN